MYKKRIIIIGATLAIVALLVAVFVHFGHKPSKVQFDPYELEWYNGSVVTGSFSSEKEGKYCLNLHSDSTGYSTVMVSEQTYRHYSMGDTIRVVRPVEHVDSIEDGSSEETAPVDFPVQVKTVQYGEHQYLVTSLGGICHDDFGCPYCNSPELWK